MGLADEPLTPSTVGLVEGLITTRAIRRYTFEPIPDDVLRAMFFAATRAASGSNRQPFRFLVLRDSPVAQQAKALLAAGARRMWSTKRGDDGYDKGTGAIDNSPKARMAQAMTSYVENFEKIPLVVIPLYAHFREPNGMEDASVYPAVQNLLLAARAYGYGGVITGFQGFKKDELRALFELPDHVEMKCTLTFGKPAGGHGPVRRRPISELIFEDTWHSPAPFAVDPPGTRFTKAGPPGTWPGP